MRFSVLVPVYNAGQYLKSCIQSVLDQTFSEFELILVDDGSTDQSGAICDDFGKTDARIRVFHKSNGGQLSARLLALQNATGQITLFLDADDRLKPGALERIDGLFEQYGCDCVFFGLERVENGVVVGAQIENETVFINDKRLLLRKFLLSSNYNSLCQKAVRSELVPKTAPEDLYGVRHGEDLLQSLGIYQNLSSALFLSEALYLYTKNPNSVSSSFAYLKYAQDLLTVQARVRAFCENAPELKNEDLYDLDRYALSQFARLILIVARAPDAAGAKIKLFDTLQSDAYYRKILSAAPLPEGRMGRIVAQFRARRYRIIILKAVLYQKLKQKKA